MGLPGPAARLLEEFSTFEDLPAAVALLSADGTVLRANDAVSALLGRPETQVLGHDAADLVVAAQRGLVREIAGELTDRGVETLDRSVTFVRPDAVQVPAVARVRPVRDDDGGVVVVLVHVVACSDPGDATAALDRAAHRSQALVRLHERLAAEPRVLESVGAVAAEALHDLLQAGVSVFAVDPADPAVLEPVAVRTGGAASDEALRRVYAERPLRTDTGVFGAGCRSEHPLVLDDPWDVARPTPAMPEYSDWLAAHPVRALLLVPLRSEDRVLGLLAAGRQDASPFTADEVAYAEHVAQAVSGVLPDALLHALERRQASRQRVVAEVTRRCDLALDRPDDVLDAAVAAVAEELDASCAAWLTGPDGSLSSGRTAVAHVDPAVDELLRATTGDWAAAPFLRRVVEDGSAFVVGADRLAEMAGEVASLRPHAAALAVDSLLGVRLTARGQVVGVLTVGTTGRTLSVEERRVVEVLGDRLAVALDNAELLGAARSSRSRARALVEHCSDLLLMTDREGAITYASPAAARTFGGRLGKTLLSAVVPEDRPLVVRAWQGALSEAGVSPAQDVRVVDAGGRLRRLSAVANNLLDDPTVGGVVLTVRDVTEERAATTRLAQRAGQQAALAAIGATALTAELDALYRVVAKTIAETLEASSSGVAERQDDDSWLVRGGSDERFVGARLEVVPTSGLATVAATGLPVRVDDYADPDDESGVVEPGVVEEYGMRSGIVAPVLVGGRVWGAVAASSTVPRRFSSVDTDFLRTVATVVAGAVERAVMSERVLAQATTDDLTGLPNRVVVQQELNQALVSGRSGGDPVALLLLDLDDFKDVNDSLGHGAGDTVLAQLGRRLDGVVGGRGSLARLGGDEFAVVLSGDCAQDAAASLAEDVARSVREPFALPGLDVTLSTSIGIAVAPGHGSTAEQLLQSADMAMYRAKVERRSWAVYDAELDSRRSERLSLLSELRLALSAGQLVLHYQPLVELASERVVEVEALVRWNHPERGLLLPAAFLPTAEQTDLVHGLTRYVVRAAARQARLWRAQGWDGTVAVNVSALALREPELVAQLRDELLRGGGALTVELTESALLDERARAAVQTLAAAGIACSIDDFGTGWSSLSYLRDLPVTRLKLDRAFNRDVDRDDKDAAIVGSVVQMAHAVGLDVVAEGVETAEVAARLRTLDVDVAQGWLYGRPQPASALRLR